MTNPPIRRDKLRDDKNYTGITFDIECIIPTDKQLAELEPLLTKDLVAYLLPKIKSEVPSLISYTDFFGEAEEFLRQTNQSWSFRKIVATKMYTNFLEALDESVYYDETEKCLCIKSKYLSSFDYGDYYSPAYEIIRKLMAKWIVERQENMAAKNKTKR